jgi:peroxiredoxin
MRQFLMFMAISLLVCCSRAPDPTSAPEAGAAIEDWLVTVQLPQVELPVHLHLAADGGEAWFSNGLEQARVDDIRRTDDGWILRFPAFNNTVRLQETDEGLAGSLTLVKRGYEQVMELSARPYDGHRFAADPEPAIDVTGRWEVTFTEDDGTRSFAVGEFDQQGAEVTGTFLTPKGDYRYLAGEVDGNIMNLSTFDGAHAFVFSAQARPDGSLTGDFWSGTRWHESWVAHRNFDARLPDAYSLTYLKDGYDRLAFTFPDLDGRPVSLDDEKFRDKVVLVTLAGTWCPNCGDEAAFLAGYFRENRDRGLEIITLLYEHFEDFETAASQGKALREKYGIEHDLLIGGSSDKARAAETLPMLNHVLAYPTIIFIDRDGAVSRIHTGFSGPGTGDHYARFKMEFTSLMDELLAETAREGS